MTDENTDKIDLKLCECGRCDELIPVRDKRGRPRRFKNGHVNIGIHHYRFGFGRKTANRRYYKLYVPDHPNCDDKGCVFEHRLEMEKKLGRYLTDKEDVHHINRNGKDNRIENLQLVTKSEHSRIHTLGNKRGKKDLTNRMCHICNSKLTYLDKKGVFRWYRHETGFICQKCWSFVYKEKKKSAYKKRLWD